MKLLYKGLSFIFAILASMGALSAKAQDYPDFYLKGTQTGWDPTPEYKFTRTGARYFLHLKDWEGQFKISNSDWSINYGASSPEETEIDDPDTVLGMPNGFNWEYEFPRTQEITVTFIYNKYHPTSSTKISFLEGFLDLPFEPDPNPDVDPNQYTASGTLPILYINVYKDETHTELDQEIIDKNLSHKNYFEFAEYWLDLNGCKWMEALGAKSVGSKEAPLPLEIKARGNYTRTGFSKKPFKLKLGKKQNLLGLTPEKSKHYAILAHADDTEGYLRNFTGFNLGKRIGLPWTPGMQPVEVFINNNYRGLYFLTESIRIGDGRVMIEELDDNVSDPSIISGGYLVELDNYDEENQIQMMEKPFANGDPVLRVTFDTPEEYSDIQRRFITDQFTAINDNIGNNSALTWSYLDLDDAARYYVVEEILGHTESYHGSTYLFRDRGEGRKWHFSPLWDCGNAFRSPNDRRFFQCETFGNTWIHTLVNNKEFKDKVEATWKWFMTNKFDGLYNDMQTYCSQLVKAAESDYKRWNNAPIPDSANATRVCDNRDMMNKYEKVKRYLEERINFLVREFGDFRGQTFPEPEYDKTPAAPLPQYITSGVQQIEGVENTEGMAEFYSIEGLRIEKPSKGLYIEVKNGRSSKKIAY